MRSHPVRHASLAAVALLAVTAPAQAAVTRTQISAPAGNPAVVVTSASTPANVIVTGTSNGGSASLDLRCDASRVTLVHSGIVPRSSGSFSYRLSARELSTIVGRTCVLRALPHASVPRDRAAFSGPVMAVSELSLRAIPAGGSAGPLADFSYVAAQTEGRATYNGMGACALRNDSVFASNLFASPTLTSCAARLGADVGARSSLFVDGASTFFPQNVWSYAPKGIAPITYALSVDPATGAPTVRDIETPLRCTPVPTAFPPNASTCSVFESAPIKVDRTWVQGSNGRVSTVTDTYTSTDGKAHHIDVVYQNGFNGTPPAFAFPVARRHLAGARHRLHRAEGPEGPGDLAGAAHLAQADNDPNAPAGSLTFKNIPDRLYLLNTTHAGAAVRPRHPGERVRAPQLQLLALDLPGPGGPVRRRRRGGADAAAVRRPAHPRHDARRRPGHAARSPLRGRQGGARDLEDHAQREGQVAAAEGRQRAPLEGQGVARREPRPVEVGLAP